MNRLEIDLQANCQKENKMLQKLTRNEYIAILTALQNEIDSTAKSLAESTTQKNYWRKKLSQVVSAHDKLFSGEVKEAIVDPDSEYQMIPIEGV